MRHGSPPLAADRDQKTYSKRSSSSPTVAEADGGGGSWRCSPSSVVGSSSSASRDGWGMMGGGSCRDLGAKAGRLGTTARFAVRRRATALRETVRFFRDFAVFRVRDGALFERLCRVRLPLEEPLSSVPGRCLLLRRVPSGSS